MMADTSIAVIGFTDLKLMAETLGKNKMFGKSAEDLLPLMLIAQAEGIHPALAAQEYDIIQGRPALNARSIQARFQNAGGFVRWDVRTDNEATVTVMHPRGGEVKSTWTLDRAKKAGLVDKQGSMYLKFPQQMLGSRAVAEAVRACYPACLNGMYSRAEVEDDVDFQTPVSEAQVVRNVTPEKGTSSEKLAEKIIEPAPAVAEPKPEPAHRNDLF